MLLGHKPSYADPPSNVPNMVPKPQGSPTAAVPFSPIPCMSPPPSSPLHLTFPHSHLLSFPFHPHLPGPFLPSTSLLCLHLPFPLHPPTFPPSPHPSTLSTSLVFPLLHLPPLGCWHLGLSLSVVLLPPHTLQLPPPTSRGIPEMNGVAQGLHGPTPSHRSHVHKVSVVPGGSKLGVVPPQPLSPGEKILQHKNTS